MIFTGTVEEGDTGTTVLMRGTDTGEIVCWSCRASKPRKRILTIGYAGIGAQGVTSIETLTGNTQDKIQHKLVSLKRDHL